ncbi:mitochondrial uncoupling protein 3-like [Coffea arabica]|nr:mitochondrial uncoupling protein 3 [Coffea arabica]
MKSRGDGETTTSNSNSKKILLTSLSAMVAETSTFPIDLIKTRLQLHGERQSALSLTPKPTRATTNTFKIAYQILRNDGLFGLYNGLSPAILRHLFYTPIRIVGYEHLRAQIRPSDHPLSLSTKPILGGISGAIAQIVASPADLIKVRMQADTRMVNQGLRPRYLGPFDALCKIISQEGFGGLWKGVFPNVQRAFLVNMGELACYDHAKHFVIQNQIAEDNIYAHTLSSIMSGLSATALSCPADVVKTRMMYEAAGVDGKAKYQNSFDCLVRTVKIEGFGALWKGFFPTWARLGPWQFVFWVSYEKLRQIAGLSSF